MGRSGVSLLLCCHHRCHHCHVVAIAIVVLLLLLCYLHCCVVAIVLLLLLLCHHHCHCHIITTIVIAFITSFGVHRGAGPRASAGGLSSMARDTVAIVVCRGTGPRGPMDRSGCQKDLAREHSLSVDTEQKSALQGCWTMGKRAGRSSSVTWDQPWLVCMGALYQRQVLVGHLVSLGTP